MFSCPPALRWRCAKAAVEVGRYATEALRVLDSTACLTQQVLKQELKSIKEELKQTRKANKMAEAEKAEADKEVNSRGAESLYGVCMSVRV